MVEWLPPEDDFLVGCLPRRTFLFSCLPRRTFLFSCLPRRTFLWSSDCLLRRTFLFSCLPGKTFPWLVQCSGRFSAVVGFQCGGWFSVRWSAFSAVVGFQCGGRFSVAISVQWRVGSVQWKTVEKEGLKLSYCAREQRAHNLLGVVG